MTENEWLTSTDPQAMLTFLRDIGKLSERRARLFAVACCRRIWRFLTSERSRKAVETAEQFADGLCCKEELRAAAAAAYDVAMDFHARSDDPGSPESEYHAAFAAWDVSTAGPAHQTRALGQATRAIAWEDAGYDYGPEAGLAAEIAERGSQCVLLRDIVHNPFKARPSVAQDVLAWDDGFIEKLATAIYEERMLPEGTLDSVRLGVLADALEEAGVTDPDILGHLRQPEGVHVRGCFVVDLILDKE